MKRALGQVVVFGVLYVGAVVLAAMAGAPAYDRLFPLIIGDNETIRTVVDTLFASIVAVGFVAGLLIVVRWSIDRSLTYFDALFDSVEGILTKREGPIELPEELAPTQSALNAIKAAAEQSERAAQAAEQRKDELVVYLAHDIKTPLTSIVGYLSLLVDDPDLPRDTRRRYAGIALEKADRLEALLSELFEITRYNLQEIPLDRSTIDAHLFCSQVIDELYPLARTRDLALVYQGPEELAVRADAARVARILNNVLKNAVAYADPATEIVVSTCEKEGAGGIPWWEISVANRGGDLTEGQLDDVFEKFYRADEARSGNVGGAGLGLAIARELARAHGGDIYALCEAGETTFTVWIPQGDSCAQAMGS